MMRLPPTPTSSSYSPRIEGTPRRSHSTRVTALTHAHQEDGRPPDERHRPTPTHPTDELPLEGRDALADFFHELLTSKIQIASLNLEPSNQRSTPLPRPPPTEPSRRSRSSLAYVLTFIGLAQGLFYVVGWDEGRLLMSMTGVSPLPLVFNTFRGHEYWSAQYSLEYETQEGARWLQKFGSSELNQIGGPHFVKMGYMASASMTSAISDAYWKDSLTDAVCDGGPIADRLGVTEDITRFWIITTDRPGLIRDGDRSRAAEPGEQGGRTWRVAVVCP